MQYEIYNNNFLLIYNKSHNLILFKSPDIEEKKNLILSQVNQYDDIIINEYKEILLKLNNLNLKLHELLCIKSDVKGKKWHCKIDEKELVYLLLFDIGDKEKYSCKLIDIISTLITAIQNINKELTQDETNVINKKFINILSLIDDKKLSISSITINNSNSYSENLLKENKMLNEIKEENNAITNNNLDIIIKRYNRIIIIGIILFSFLLIMTIVHYAFIKVNKK